MTGKPGRSVATSFTKVTEKPEIMVVFLKVQPNTEIPDLCPYFCRHGLTVLKVKDHRVVGPDFSSVSEYLDTYRHMSKIQKSISSVWNQPCLVMVLEGPRGIQTSRALSDVSSDIPDCEIVHVSDSEESALVDIYMWLNTEFPGCIFPLWLHELYTRVEVLIANKKSTMINHATGRSPLVAMLHDLHKDDNIQRKDQYCSKFYLDYFLGACQRVYRNINNPSIDSDPPDPRVFVKISG